MKLDDILSPSAQPEMTTLKATFVPGDKTIFFDDFTDMAKGATVKADGLPKDEAAAAYKWWLAKKGPKN